MVRIILAGALIALATPAVATERAHSPQQVSDALKAGCIVQHVHTPAGKSVQASPIVHCKQARDAQVAAAQVPTPNKSVRTSAE